MVIEDLFESDGSAEWDGSGPGDSQLGLGEHLWEDTSNSLGLGCIGTFVLRSWNSRIVAGGRGGLGWAEDAI